MEASPALRKPAIAIEHIRELVAREVGDTPSVSTDTAWQFSRLTSQAFNRVNQWAISRGLRHKVLCNAIDWCARNYQCYQTEPKRKIVKKVLLAEHTACHELLDSITIHRTMLLCSWQINLGSHVGAHWQCGIAMRRSNAYYLYTPKWCPVQLPV